MHHLSELKEKWPQCIQHAAMFCVIGVTLILCKLKELSLQAEGK